MGQSASTVREVCALTDLDEVAVRIADVAADLAVFGERLGDELGSSTFPYLIACLNVRDTEVQKAAEEIRVGNAERYRRLVLCRAASYVHNHPDIRELKVPGRVAVAQAQNASAEDLFVVTSRSLDVLHREKVRDAHPVLRRHLIALLFDFHAGHWRLQFRRTVLTF